MPTIVETLQQKRERLPNWLAGDGLPHFDRQAFFASRTV